MRSYSFDKSKCIQSYHQDRNRNPEYIKNHQQYIDCKRPHQIKFLTTNSSRPVSRQGLQKQPEVLVLLQSAEIERLNQQLYQSENKFQTIKRQQLNHQSFETQIKQISQRASKAQDQIRRLNEIIKAQNSSLEEYQKQLLFLQNQHHQHQTEYILIQKAFQNNKREREMLLIEKQNLKMRNLTLEEQFKAQKNHDQNEIKEMQRNNHELHLEIIQLQNKLAPLQQHNEEMKKMSHYFNPLMTPQRHEIMRQQREKLNIISLHLKQEQLKDETQKRQRIKSLDLLRNSPSNIAQEKEQLSKNPSSQAMPIQPNFSFVLQPQPTQTHELKISQIQKQRLHLYERVQLVEAENKRLSLMKIDFDLLKKSFQFKEETIGQLSKQNLYLRMELQKAQQSNKTHLKEKQSKVHYEEELKKIRRQTGYQEMELSNINHEFNLKFSILESQTKRMQDLLAKKQHQYQELHQEYQELHQNYQNLQLRHQDVISQLQNSQRNQENLITNQQYVSSLINSLEKHRSTILEQSKQISHLQHHQQLSSGSYQKMYQLNGKIDQLNGEIYKLNGKIDQLSSTNQKLQFQNQHLEKQIQSQRIIHQRDQQQISAFSEKNNLLTTENFKLTQIFTTGSAFDQVIKQKQKIIQEKQQEIMHTGKLLQSKISECEGLKRKIIENQKQLKISLNESNELQNKLHSDQITNIIKQNELASQKFLEMIAYKKKNKNLQKQNKILHDRLKIAQQIVKCEKNKAELLSNKFESLRLVKSVQKSTPLAQNKRILLLQEEIKKMNSENKDLNKKLESLHSLNKQNHLYQNKISIMSQEIIKLHKIIQSDPKHKKTKLDFANNYHCNCLAKIQKIQKSLLAKQQNILNQESTEEEIQILEDQFEKEKFSLKSQILNLQTQNKKCKEDLQKLSHLLNSKIAENEKLKRELIENESQLKKNFDEQYEYQDIANRQKIINLTKQNHQMQKRILENIILKKQFTELEAEKEVLLRKISELQKCDKLNQLDNQSKPNFD